MLEQANPSTSIQTLPKLGEFGCRLGTAVCSACKNRGTGWWGAAGGTSQGDAAIECLKDPQNPIPGLLRAPWGHGWAMLLRGRCRDHDAAQTSTTPTASQSPASLRYLNRALQSHL